MKQYMYHCSKCKTSDIVSVGVLFSGKHTCSNCGSAAETSGMAPKQWESLNDGAQARVFAVLPDLPVSNSRTVSLLILAMNAALCVLSFVNPSIHVINQQQWVTLLLTVAFAFTSYSKMCKENENLADKILEQIGVDAEQPQDA